MNRVEKKLIGFAIEHLMASEDDPEYSWEKGMDLLMAMQAGTPSKLVLLLDAQPKNPRKKDS